MVLALIGGAAGAVVASSTYAEAPSDPCLKYACWFFEPMQSRETPSRTERTLAGAWIGGGVGALLGLGLHASARKWVAVDPEHVALAAGGFSLQLSYQP